MLRKQPLIQRSLAAFLLLLFAVCIAPRNFVHDALAQHTDRTACDHPLQAEVCLHPSEKHCHFNEPLQSTACLLLEMGEATFLQTFVNTYAEGFCTQVASMPAERNLGRGPPDVL